MRKVGQASGRGCIEGGLQPPSPKELSGRMVGKRRRGSSQFLKHLVHEGVLVKIKSEIYFHRFPLRETERGIW